MSNLNAPVSVKSIAFIDTQVPNYQSLVAGVTPGTEVVVLDGNEDAIAKITDILALRANIDSIHIVSHGAPGSLQLGNGSLSLDDLEGDRHSLQQWFSPLGKNRSNILLYGCEIAAGETGKAFVKRLSELTGASVAASQNLTGSVAKGGDWELEVTTGEIKTPLVFVPEVLANYEHVLNSFSTATNFGAGPYPVFVDVGDFNGDKIKDLAVTNANAPINGSNPGTSILLANSPGSFGTATPLGKGPNAFAIADFNIDGFDDLVADNGAGSLSIFLGSKSGLGTPVNLSFDTRIAANYIVAADFNNDKRPDIAVASNRATTVPNTSAVSILLQNLDGTFSSPLSYAVGKQPTSITVGDFDGDGKKDDLASTNRTDNTVSILLANDSGVFTNGPTIPVGTGPNSIAVGKFDADNRDDLAVGYNPSNNISILLQKSPGTFTAAPNLGVSANFLAAGDIDGDGKSDLAVPNGTYGVSVLIGKGNGEFSNPTDFPLSSSANSYQSVVVKDIDGDQRLDIAATSFNDNNVSILLNTPNTVNFGAATYSGTEGTTDTVVNVPLTLSGGTPLTDVIVPIAIDPSSSATQNSDYTIAPTSITFPAGATGAALTKNVAVTIKPDNLPENAETAILNFGTITGGVGGTTKQTTLTIAANGQISYAVAADTASIPEGNSGTTPLTFTVTRSGSTAVASSVNYTIGGTATNVSDYNSIGGTSGATAATGTINFAANETSKTITLNVIGDGVVESDETIAVTLSNPVAPGLTPAITTATSTITINNDDTASFKIAPTSTTATEGPGGATGSYTVKLTSQPSAPVSVSFNTGSQINAISLPIIFDSTNWNVAQTVTVTATDDSLAEKTHSGTITHTAATTDTNYSSLTIPSVTVSITDNDSPGVSIIQSTGSTDIGEGAATDTYKLVLTTAPTAPVTINFDSGSQINSIASLTFTPANWNVAQTVSVSAIDDSLAEGTHSGTINHTAVSTDTNYNGLTISPVTATIADNDTEGVSIAPTSTTATEGGATGSYTVKLKSQPTAPVTINFTAGSQINAISPIILDSTNWKVGQTVTVTATNDTKAEGTHGGTISHTVTSADTKYSGKPVQDVNVVITDNETATVSISPTSTTATEGGATGSYTVKLNSEPNAPVNLSFNTGSQINAISAITFDSTSWNVGKAITVTATDDTTAEGAHSGTITHTVTSSDTQYSGTPVQDVNVAITDNETAGVNISPTSTTATEGGATGSYTVKLNSKPNAPVNLKFNTSGQINAISAITFDSTNWNVAKTVTVSAVDDTVAEGAHSGTITHTVTSTDTQYSGKAVQDVNVAITDNETAGVSISPTSTTATEGGATGSYTVKLNSQPSAPVNLSFNTGNQINPISAITFDSSNWNVAKTVKVIATDDEVLEGAHSGSIAHTVASTDAKYNGIGIAGVSVAIEDNDKVFTNKLDRTIPGYVGPNAWGDFDNDGDLDLLVMEGGSAPNNYYQSFPRSAYTPKVYRNDNDSGSFTPNDSGSFTAVDIGLPTVYGGILNENGKEYTSKPSATWGDRDNDGDLDILLTGVIDTPPPDPFSIPPEPSIPAKPYTPITRLYLNPRIDNFPPPFPTEPPNLDKFSLDRNVKLPGIFNGSAAWGDYNNDGTPDLVLTGDTGAGGYIAKVFRNEGRNFEEETGAKLPGVKGNAAWGDYDNDGNKDILLTGDTGSEYIAKLYRNTGNGFTEKPLPQSQNPNEPIIYGAWGDSNSDGKIDILLTGGSSRPNESNYGRTRLLGNNSNGDTTSFLEAYYPFGYGGSRGAWGDYDNNGKLDILVTELGGNSGSSVAKVYAKNDSGSNFELLKDAGLPDNVASPSSWGDYNKDGRLDIALTTKDNSPGSNDTFVKVYRNNTSKPNTPPSAPQGLSVDYSSNDGVSLDGVNLKWQSVGGSGNPIDAQTPPQGLSYNLQVWTTRPNPKGGDEPPIKEYIIAGPMSLDNGTRQVVQLGNVNQAKSKSSNAWEYSWGLKPDYLIPGKTYNWSVQAIDGAWAGSPFSEVKSFVAPDFPGKVSIVATDPNAAEVALPYPGTPGNPGEFTITRTGSLDKELFVPLKLDENTTVNFTDYEWSYEYFSWREFKIISETLPTLFNLEQRVNVTIPANQRSVKIVVKPVDDSRVEGDEKVVISLGTPETYNNVGEPSTATVTIADNDRNNPVRTGVVIDGYIDGANLFLDANKNGIKDTNEPSTTTDTGGKFNLNIPFETFDTDKNGEIDPEEGNLVATGGTDTATGLPLEIPITAPPDSTVVTPLTSLIAELIDKGIAPEEAQSLIKAALGIPANVDLTSFDPIDATNNNQPGGVQVLAAMVKVQNFITQTVALIDGASSAATKDLVKSVVISITNQIQSSPVLNLSNAAALEPIIQQAAAKIQQIDSSFNIQKVTSITSQAATVMAIANQRIDSAVSSTATSITESVSRVQQIALGATTQDFKAIGTGNKTISQLVAENTGAALDAQIQAVTSPAGIATPVVTGDADLGGNSGNPINGTNGDDILTGTSSNDVLMGMRGNDSLDGAAGNDTIFGGKGFDSLLGSGGDDVLYAGRGADILNGGDGNDNLYGGKGDDFLNGGLGSDTLTGGKGLDKFLLDSNSGTDTIADFEDGKDLLILGNGVTFSQLAITESNGLTQISFAATGKVFASLTGVSATAINAADFSLL
ncbi:MULTISPECIES: DUF4347 domain-containing protein [unclassified Microcoleus]|uniref:DUF4347 domain-containing protein n=1 Tax=unclassified Microcoleus TaxID=2642155 RepID=UPI0025EA5AE3|nr:MULTISPECIES: DUF4347 domain-containing protein [unclassified Microcoleus]